MLFTNPQNEFLAFQHIFGTSTLLTEAPSVTNGTPNVKGSWVDLLGTTVTHDAYGIWIRMADNTPIATKLPLLFDIGVDPAGGTSYNVLVSNLAVSGPTFPSNHGYRFFFPLFVKAGSTIAARSQSSAAAHAVKVAALLFQKPTRPEVVRYGSYVETLGADTANSRGTVLTPGVNGAYGAWTSIGTSTKEGFFFQAGFSIDSDHGTGVVTVDYAIGTAGTKRTLVPNQRYSHSGTDVASDEMYQSLCYRNLPAGTEFFARASTRNGVANANTNVTIHVVGG